MNNKAVLVVNVALRLGLVLSRTLFIFIIAKYLTLEDIGTYSILGITIGFSLYLIGMDFYAHTSRAIIGSSELNKTRVIIKQIQFSILSYLFYILPISLIFIFSVISIKWFLVFFVILFFENLSQELTRILIALEKQVDASIVLFVRAAMWVYVLLFAFSVSAKLQTLELVMWLWLFFSFLSVVLATYFLKFIPWSSVLTLRPDWAWIKKGMKIALPMMVATICFKLIFIGDRYYLELTDGLAQLGVYSVYLGVCNAILSFSDAALFQFYYPKLVRYSNEKNFTELKSSLIELLIKSIAFIFLSIIGLVIIIEFVFGMLGKEEYLYHIDNFWALACAHFIFILSNVAHYGLFAMKKDRWILISHFFAAVAFAFSLLVLDSENGFMNVSIALNISMLVLLVVKWPSFIITFKNVLKKY